MEYGKTEGVQDRFSLDKPTLDRRWHTFITIGGAGTIGSWTAYNLAQLGFKLRIYDFDTVEIHNVGVQFFGANQLGLKKTAALAQNIMGFVGTNGFKAYEKFEAGSLTSLHVVAGFDNLPSRFAMYTEWQKLVVKMKESNVAGLFSPATGAKPLFVDARINRGSYIIYPVTAEDDSMRYYEDNVFGHDTHSLEPPCYDKTYAGVGSGVAWEITNLFAKCFRTDFVPAKEILFDYLTETRKVTY